MGGAAIAIGRAELSDQGKLGEFLLAVCGGVLAPENGAAAAGLPASSLEDELMAADDFYFSTIELMDCCRIARDGDSGAVVGAACVNPYTNELHYVAVAESHRRRGIGKKLVELCLEELEKRGSDHVRVESSLRFADAGGREFAAACGFLPVRSVCVMGRKLAGEGLPDLEDDDED
jgi:GNAT superfamily N-acetyltransferase